jgi:hypothetical protein
MGPRTMWAILHPSSAHVMPFSFVELQDRLGLMSSSGRSPLARRFRIVFGLSKLERSPGEWSRESGLAGICGSPFLSFGKLVPGDYLLPGDRVSRAQSPFASRGNQDSERRACRASPGELTPSVLALGYLLKPLRGYLTARLHG